MGCNVSKDVKVEDQGNPDNAANGGDKTPMSEEKAAEKIQASFRGYKTRKTLKNNGVLPANTNGEEEDKSKEEKTEEKSSAKPNPTQSTDNSEILDIDLTDKDLEKAAAKIQASYRKYTKKRQDTPPSPTKEEPVQNDTENNDEENLDDIDLEDPQVEKAALKIQSTFRGYKVRKEVKDEMPNGEKGEDEA